MRRKNRQLTEPGKIREAIAACDCSRLGSCGDGSAYVVRLDCSLTERDGHYTFYFHSAKNGRKIDLIRESGWASFEMDTGHQVVSDEIACEYTARFRCVMGGGPAALLETAEEKRAGLTALMEHAAGPGPWTVGDAMVDAAAVSSLQAEELSCKELRWSPGGPGNLPTAAGRRSRPVNTALNCRIVWEGEGVCRYFPPLTCGADRLSGSARATMTK